MPRKCSSHDFARVTELFAKRFYRCLLCLAVTPGGLNPFTSYDEMHAEFAFSRAD